MSNQSNLNVLICGGGNGAHVFSTLASSRENVIVNVLTTFENEADKWTSGLSRAGQMVVTAGDRTMTGKPSKVTKDAKEVVPYANYIFIVVPAYAHFDVLSTIAGSCQAGTVVVAMPGHPGFEYEYAAIFKEKVRQCFMVSFETLPWACRLRDYGVSSEIIGTKQTVSAAVWRGVECSVDSDSALARIQWLLGEEPAIHLLENLLCLTLACKTIIHPPIMYAQWNNWDGLPLKEKPLFYQGAQDEHAHLLSEVNSELVAIAEAFERCQEFKWDLTAAKTTILDWYRDCYGNQIADDRNLKNALQTNAAYAGLTHPMREVSEGGYVPDFTYRYTTEDIPFGLVVFKGLAEIVSVETPAMDKIIEWGQKLLGQNIIQGSRLNNVKVGRAPQRFDIRTVRDLLKFLNQQN